MGSIIFFKILKIIILSLNLSMHMQILLISKVQLLDTRCLHFTEKYILTVCALEAHMWQIRLISTHIILRVKVSTETLSTFTRHF